MSLDEMERKIRDNHIHSAPSNTQGFTQESLRTRDTLKSLNQMNMELAPIFNFKLHVEVNQKVMEAKMARFNGFRSPRALVHKLHRRMMSDDRLDKSSNQFQPLDKLPEVHLRKQFLLNLNQPTTVLLHA